MIEFLLAAVIVLLLGCLYFAWRAGTGARQLERLVAESGRMEQELRAAIVEGRREALEAARAGREEQAAALTQIGQGLTQQLALNAQGLTQNLNGLSESNQRRIGELRETVEKRLAEMQQGNEKKLEQMRATVDEKLHKTLEQRLSESFKQVSERLEQVHKGLGEMQTLAAGVGDLKRVLTNVKTRGTWGEIQLGNLLEQMLTAEQYDKNVATRPGSRERVEYAVKLPGREGAPVWVPIDCKFPLEDYQRLQEAQDAADPVAVEQASKQLESRVRAEAKSIAEKYVEPPHTTDFALLYLPIEGLYAELVRRPGLAETLQRDHRVALCGPTTLSAYLNSLQMGFRTLAIEKQASRVWEVLGQVKTEFGKFGVVLANTKKKLEQATNSIGDAEVRTRAITRRLKDVEALPSAEEEFLPEEIENPAGENPAEIVDLLPRLVDRD